MAIIPDTEYPGKTAGANANYPYGEPRNVISPGDGLGTPFEAAYLKDIYALLQGLLVNGAVVPNGTPDTVLASQYLEALQNIIEDSDFAVANLTTGDTDTTKRLAPNGGGGVQWTVNNLANLVAGSNDLSARLRPNGSGGVDLVQNTLIELVAGTNDTSRRLAPNGSGGVTTVSSIASIGQGELKTAIGTVTNNTVGPRNYILPGGQYGFYPQFEKTAGAVSDTGAQIALNTIDTAFITNINLDNDGGGGTVSARQRYVQASPPVNIGDGLAFAFDYMLVDKNGKVVSSYFADVPPFLYNGPTDVSGFYRKDKNGVERKYQKQMRRECTLEQLRNKEVSLEEFKAAKCEEVEIEVDDTIKNKDSIIIPHPFIGNDLTDLTVVLIDTTITEDLLAMHIGGENIAMLYNEGYLEIGDKVADNPNRISMPGVEMRKFKWADNG